MRQLTSKLTRTRTCKVIAATLSTFLVTAVAFAAYTFLIAGSGTSTYTLSPGVKPTGEVTLSAVVESGSLQPGGEVPTQIDAKNSTTTPTDIKTLTVGLSVDATHAAAGCKAEWFTFTASDAFSNELLGTGAKEPMSIPIGFNEPVIGAGSGRLHESASATNACLSAEQGGVGATPAVITFTLHSTP